jgi:AcrR family transcriptional regulator
MALLDASVDCSGAALRRKQILDAARDAFRSHGFHAASMAVVAAGAKMSVGQIYRYFDNKEAIVAAIVGEHIEEFMRDLTMLASEDGPLSERLLNNFSQSIGRHIDSGFLSLTYEVRAEAARHPDLQQILVAKDRQIQDRIVDLMKSTDLARLSSNELSVRAEQVCLLFEGVVARIGRRKDFDINMINMLVRPLLTAVLTPDEPDCRRGTTSEPIRRRS